MAKKNEMIVNNENELTNIENIYQDICKKEFYPIWSTVPTELS